MNVSADNQDFLYQQVQNWLKQQIKLGKLKPGSRLPGERSLAEQLKISRTTTRLALQKLEAAGTINRIPSKGAFISTKANQRKLRLALLYPETDISLKNLHYANWTASSEMQRGALSACSANNATLTFQHVPESNSSTDLAKSIIKEYDGAIFIGHQLDELKKKLANFDFQFFNIGDFTCNSVEYDRQEICEIAAKYLYNCGCRQVFLPSAHTSDNAFNDKLEIFKRFFDIQPSNIINCDVTEDGSLERLRAAFPTDDKSALPDVFFCTTTVIPFALLRLAKERNWNVPNDFMIMGYANNMDIRPTEPTLTYIKVPYFEMGRTGTEILIRSIVNCIPTPEREYVSAELIIGNTTRKKNK